MSHGDLGLIITRTESIFKKKKKASLIPVRQYFMSNKFSQKYLSIHTALVKFKKIIRPERNYQDTDMLQ